MLRKIFFLMLIFAMVAPCAYAREKVVHPVLRVSDLSICPAGRVCVDGSGNFSAGSVAIGQTGSISESAGAMSFADGNNPAGVTLSELIAGGAGGLVAGDIDTLAELNTLIGDANIYSTAQIDTLLGKAALLGVLDLETTDSPSYAAMTLTGANGLRLGVAGTTQGLIRLYSNVPDNTHYFDIFGGAEFTENVGWRAPVSMPTVLNALVNVDVTTGQIDYTDPASFVAASAVTDFADTLLDDDNATEARSTLGLGAASTLGTGTLTDTYVCVYSAANGLVCNTDPATLGGGFDNLTDFDTQTAWRVFYSDGNGDVTELALGADGEYLKSNGAAAAPSWATPSGAAHDAVTLSIDLGNNLLGISTQQITLDNQTANYIFAGPATGAAAAPAFRAIVDADIPSAIARDTELHAAVTLGSGIGGLTLSTQELGLSARLEGYHDFTDPDADRIWFWDDSAGAFAGLATGNSMSITATTIDTIQDIRTTATPQFARIGIGQAADGTNPIASTGFSVDPDGDTTAKSLTIAASASPGFDLRDSDNPGTDKWSASFEAAYVDGADGAENSDVLIYTNQGGTKTLIAQFDESDDRWESAFAASLNGVLPDAAGGANIGSTSLEWSNVYLSDGAVIYGQNDQTATLTSSASLWTANNFAVTTQFKLPSSNADPTATAGYLRHDSTVTGLTTGALAWHDGDEIRYIVDLDVLPSNDDYVVAYDADNDNFYMKADATGAGGSGSMTTVKESDSQVGGADIVTLDFGAGFDVAESPDTEVQISLDMTEYTGNYVIADSGTITFDESAADPNDADVVLSATDGVMKFAASNGANNEDLTIDLDGTANTATIGSTTGVTALSIGALNFSTTGTILGAVNIVTTTDGTESPTAAQMYGTMFIADHGTATSDTDYTLPSAVAGMTACFYDNGGGAGGVIIDAASGDEILLDGTGVGAADAIDSPGVAGDGANGDFICLMAIDATYWITLGRSGTWVDGGAD